MDALKKELLKGFYENQLKNYFLSYWLPRCEDREFGGFVNCFTNDGATLVSRDKYTWSQGRFIWLFARLAVTPAPLFTERERQHFLALAEQGADFLMRHVLLPGKPERCAFLMEADGMPKLAEGCAALDASIYADCFAVLGLGAYGAASGRREAWDFARSLYLSIRERIGTGRFYTLPYPLDPALRAHGIPMILENVSAELLRGAQKLDPDFIPALKSDLAGYTEDILAHFADEEDRIREIIRAEGGFLNKRLGRHINPGHTLEDVWFMLDSLAISGQEARRPQIYRIAKKALELGWDPEWGGLLHFVSLEGGEPRGDNSGYEEEPMSRQLSGWDHKLWWIHSEALYTSLRCYTESRDPAFLEWHDKLFAYTFSVFPQRDPEIREWIQIRDRRGEPLSRVVALPVKDPFHVIRNLLLILELLYKEA